MCSHHLIICIRGGKKKHIDNKNNWCSPNMCVCLKIQPDIHAFNLFLCLLSLLYHCSSLERERIERWIYAVWGIRARAREERREEDIDRMWRALRPPDSISICHLRTYTSFQSNLVRIFRVNHFHSYHCVFPRIQTKDMWERHNKEYEM